MKKTIYISFDRIEEETARFQTLPGVSSAHLGGVNGQKAHPSYDEVKKGLFGYKMAIKLDYPSEKTSFTQLLPYIKEIAGEKPIGIYYTDLLDGIEIKARCFEFGLADKVNIEKMCSFFLLPSLA